MLCYFGCKHLELSGACSSSTKKFHSHGNLTKSKLSHAKHNVILSKSNCFYPECTWEFYLKANRLCAYQGGWIQLHIFCLQVCICHVHKATATTVIRQQKALAKATEPIGVALCYVITVMANHSYATLFTLVNPPLTLTTEEREDERTLSQGGSRQCHVKGMQPGKILSSQVACSG